MFKIVGSTLIVSLALLSLVWGQNPEAKPAQPPTAEQLVEQLGDPDFRKRDDAVRQLEAMGEAAMPALYKAQKHTDPEIRRRVSDLIPSLEMAALLATKKVTLKVEKKTVRHIIEELTKQTGYKIEFWVNNEQQLYDFQINDQPFWQAFDQICNTTGLVLQQGYGDDRMRLNQQEGHVPFVCYDGPLRVVANNIQHYRTIDFSFMPRTNAGTRRNDSMTFSFSIFSEPRMPILGLGEAKLTAVLDDQKQSMLVPNQNNGDIVELGGRRMGISRYGNGYRTYSQQSQVQIMKPSEKAASIKLLQGSVPVMLLAQQKPEVVTDNFLKSKGTKAQVGTTNFVIEEAMETPNKQFQLKMTITEDNKDNPNDYTWINSLSQRIELHDKDGNKYQIYGNSWGGNGPNHANVTYTYANPGNNPKIGPPTKLIYYSWSTVQHQVKFEFRDLPLP